MIDILLDFEDSDTSWNIPPADESGRVSTIARTTSQAKNGAIWQARESEPRENELIGIMQETCRTMGIKKIPRVLIYDHDWPNAAKVRFTREVMFSTKLLDIMTPDEVKAVTAHELMHLRHSTRDNITMGLNLLGAEAATAIGFNLVRNTNPQRPSTLLLKYLALSELVVNAAQFLWLGITQNWFTRRAEKEADVGAAKAVGSQSMIDSLQTLGKMEDEFHDEQEKHGRFDWRKYTTNLPIFFTHPPIEKRIDNIIKHAPKSFKENYEAEAKTPPQPYK